MTLIIAVITTLLGTGIVEQPLATDPLVKSVITIKEPNAQTVWEAPSTVSLEWTTKNIPSDKNLKFYLILDEMVVQELGTFQNIKEAGGIQLGRWLKAADNYQVMAIELYPLNPNYTAKYATPFFTIKKKPRPAVTEPEQPALEEVITEPAPEDEIIEAPVPETEEEPENIAVNTAVTKPVEPPTKPKIIEKPTPVKVVKPRPRRSRIGREVAYVKELMVKQEEITLTVWDHGEIDGDVISIFLNGKEVLTKFELSEVRHKLTLELDPARPNELMVYAHNLGELYPNTAALWISDGTRNNMVVLKSDLVKSEALRIRVGN